MKAAYHGRADICKYLITEQNSDIEAKDYNQDTALIWAALKNRIEVVKVLLDNNADIKTKNKVGGHAAFYAATHGHFEVLRLLVQYDKDVMNLEGCKGRTVKNMALSYHEIGSMCSNI